MQNLSQNGLEQIAKMQNRSQNKLERITKVLNLSRNELEKVAKMRHIKIYKNMSKEGFLIALLKPGRSFAELHKINSYNAEIEKIRENFNELRDRFSRSKIKKIINKIYKIENNENFYKKGRKTIERYLTELGKSLHKFKKYYDQGDFDYKGIRDIENLFDEVNEDCYKPIKTESAFNGNDIEYESRRDKDKILSHE